MNFKLPLSLGIAVLASVPIVQPAFSQSSASDRIEEQIILGSRRAPRSAMESAVPVDAISADEFLNQGVSDPTDLLSVLVPSFNVNTQPISDAATLIRPANLRGLPPDNTLILVNGKRRHKASVIAFLGGGLSDGAHGADTSSIPALALKRVDVLRDGAAAQYGSDAIAGVINFELNDAVDQGKVEMRLGSFYSGDGDSYQIAANYGFNLNDNGFLNLSAEYRSSKPTSRSQQRDDAAGLIKNGNSVVRNPAQIWGSPEVFYDYKFFGNLGVDMGNNRELYAFGNYSARKVEGGFFFRNPTNRGGIFDGNVINTATQKYLTATATGGDQFGSIDFDKSTDKARIAALAQGIDLTKLSDTILVADISNKGNANCPILTVDRNGVVNATELAAINNNKDCFAYNSFLPGGFTPQFGGKITDLAFVVGMKGELDSGLTYDASVNAGTSRADFYLNNTVNPQLARLGSAQPRNFRTGSYINTERNVNVDIAYPIQLLNLSDTVLAFGYEHRYENFEILNGEPNSYYVDALAGNTNTLSVQGFGVGSNGFPGFQPSIAGQNSRDSHALYADVEGDISDAWLASVAVRYESYSDFGSTTKAKLATRYQFIDNFAVRGSISGGFRAPTVGQSNVRNVTTAFIGGVLADQATLEPTNPISKRFGGKQLQPETATNFTLGAVMTLGEFDITFDYFNIKLKDRIALTDSMNITSAIQEELVKLGITDARSFSSVRFFANDFDTKTTGFDVNINRDGFSIFGGNLDVLIGYNYTDTKVTRFTNAGSLRRKQLEEGLPKHRMNVTLTWSREQWNAVWRTRYYSESFEGHLDDITLPITLTASTITDIEIGYQLRETIKLSFGAQNVFNQYPVDNPHVGIAGAKYPTTSPYGFNGGYYYIRANYDF